MHVLLLTHYFWPELGAPQVIHSEWIKRFTRKGHQVSVVTCFPHYPDGVIKAGYRNQLLMEEERDGARVFRTATYAVRNAGSVRRALNHLSLTASCWAAWPKLGAFDVVMTEYPPLFTALSGIAMARLRGVPHVLNAGDLFVEVALEMGALPQGPIGDAFLALSKAIEQRSTVVVTAEGCIEKLARYGISRDQLKYLPNSVDTERFAFDAERRRRVRAERGWRDEQIIALYHGTHGMAQNLSQVVDAAAQLRELRHVRFVLIGDGADKPAVMKRASELGVDNVDFLAPESFDKMPGLVDACDIGLVPLRRMPQFEITLPSKMFEFMSAQRPVVLGVAGDARRIVEGAGAGLAHEPDDAAGLATAVRALASDRGLRAKMGERGRAAAVERYSRDRFAHDLEQVFEKAIARNR